MGDIRLSEMKASYYPPSLQPGFMGAHPPTKTGVGSLFDNGNVNYFQNYRNENISRMQMPSHEYGMVNTPYTPRPDIAIYGKAENRYLKFPQSEISMLDAARQQEVDNFYLACQLHRDQYKDHTGTLHPLDYFKNRDYMYQCPSDPTSVYLKYPERYVKYKQPVVLPLTLERSYKAPWMPERALTGVYDRSSVVKK